MTINSNPASRLLDLLKNLRQGNPSEHILNAWANIFGLESTNEVEIMKRLVLINEMLDDIERKIKLLPNLNYEIYLACFPKIRTVFSPIQINSNRNGITPYITDDVLARLEFCSEVLKDEFSEVGLDENEILTISNQVNELFELIIISHLNSDLKSMLLEQIEKLRISINFYRIYGAKGIKSNLQNLYGIVITEKEQLKKESQENKDVINRLGKLLDKIDKVLAIAIKTHKILNKPIQYFLGLTEEGNEEKSNTTFEESNVVDV